MDINRVTLSGRVGKEPEVRTMSNGKKFVTFALATTETLTGYTRGTTEKVEKTEWHKVTIFNQYFVKMVESSLSKGDTVMLEGKLNTTKYTDKTGAERYSTQVVLSGLDSILKIVNDRPVPSKKTVMGNSQDKEELKDDGYDVFFKNEKSKESKESNSLEWGDLATKNVTRTTTEASFDDSDLIPF